MLNLEKYKVILASNSPRRRELLAQLCVEFEVAPSIEIDECYPLTLPLKEVASYLSCLKANAYKSLIDSNQLIITADTVVLNGNEVLGKPKNQSEAILMLKSLSGCVHDVITGVTITTKEKQVTFSVETKVKFAQLEDDEIEWYIKTYLPLDKAGAYGIQEWIGCIGVKSINGSFYNVMGLPLHRLYNELKRF